MAVAASTIPTISQVNKAGKRLRAWWSDPHPTEDEALYEAFETVVAYRATHRKPMAHANMGLRSVVKSQGCVAQVSQRLKQMRTIMDKLAKHPQMALTTMQDIGGCRAIVRDIAQLRRIEKKIVENCMARNGYARVDDYVESPRLSGYRAVHVIVQYGDPARNTEIQLRTPIMHAWAFGVERLGWQIGQDLKSGYGPPQVLALMEAVSEAMEHEERGDPVDSGLVNRINALRQDALPYLVARPNGRSSP